MGIRIYGNSDDQIYVERDGEKTQHDGDDLLFMIGDTKAGGLAVKISYGVGCSVPVWALEVSQIEEGISVPWPVRIENVKETDHSLALVVDCPPGTPIDTMRQVEA